MSFDAAAYVRDWPDDGAVQWERLLRERGMPMKPDIPADWRASGVWRLRGAADEAGDGLELYTSPVTPESLHEDGVSDDELERLRDMRHKVDINVRMDAGAAALMIVGTLAKVGRGVVSDPQVAAYDPAFDARLDTVRPRRGGQGASLVERGIYEPDVAMGIAKVYLDAEADRRRPRPPALLTVWTGVVTLFGALALMGYGAMAAAMLRNSALPGWYPVAAVAGAAASALAIYSGWRLREGHVRWRVPHGVALVVTLLGTNFVLALVVFAASCVVLYSPASRTYFAARVGQIARVP